MSRFMRVGEVAHELGVSVDTVRTLVADGRLPAFQTPGGQLQFRPQDVATFRRATGGARRTNHHDPGNLTPEAQAIHTNDPEKALSPRSADEASRWNQLPPWEQQKAELAAELEMDEMREEQERRAAVRSRRKADELERQSEHTRLYQLKQLGKSFCWDPDLEPEVIRELERQITAEQVPPWLTPSQQQLMVVNLARQILSDARDRQIAAMTNRQKHQNPWNS
jgi:excisionase family DNA binding protein